MTRTGSDHFSCSSEWGRGERLAGLGHGWQGWAWIWLHVQLAGLAPRSDRTLSAISRRLASAPRTPAASHSISHVIGTAANPVVASLASRLDRAFLRHLDAGMSRWVESSKRTAAFDVMAGHAGALLAAAEIESHAPGRVPVRFLRSLQGECAAVLNHLVDASVEKPVYLGMSHGLAGYLFALEAAESVFGLALDDDLRSRCIDRITAHMLRARGAVLWPPASRTDTVTTNGWCHGTPGIALAFLCCHGLTKRRDYAELALAGLEGMAPEFGDGKTFFCCGGTGRAQILLEAYRLTGHDRWLRRARFVASRFTFRPDAARSSRKSIWRGRGGHEFLKLRLRHPTLLPLPALGGFSRGATAPEVPS